ncbi:MAG: FAD-binding domain-containing protein [Verrucomicrobiota bacterium]|jgi:deoxyribodipyrimidine photo-lyase
MSLHVRQREKINLVWLKRDLRLHDHAPLAEASRRCLAGEKALVVYVRESDYWATDKASEDQWWFVAECLQGLSKRLERIGCPLLIVESPSAEIVLDALMHQYEITELLCHQETGNGWTFDRDKRVFRACRERGIPVREFLQNAVVRGRSSPPEKPQHQSFWKDWLSEPQASVPEFWRSPSTPLANLVGFVTPDLMTPTHVTRQRGGEGIALGLLESFLNERCLLHAGYRVEMGSPLHAHEACSRLSPHLTWGSLSTKRAAQAAMAREPRPPYGSMMHRNSFHRRLRWRDHFLQKFESLSWMEFRCINAGRESLHGWDENSYERWAMGSTGYPFIDACMRSLNATKWINFRARAMLVSFASYALNLDWRLFAPHLARTFLDYEPGIHYSQLQMQSGTTYGSPPRIYNPIKQSLEKDPSGEFIRRWIPELRDLSGEAIHLPQDVSRHGYPAAIVSPCSLWRVMRSNGPKTQNPKTKKPEPQLELGI